MEYTDVINTIAAFGTLSAIIVALFANQISNKNTRKQIRVDKLENLYEVIDLFSGYYGIYMPLFFDIKAYQDPENKEIQSMSDYYKKRDERLSTDDKQQIRSNLSKLEMLTKCYTGGDLQKEVLKFRDLVFSFSDLVINGGSLHYETKYKKQGFPDYDKFYKMVDELKEKIALEMAIGN